MVKSVWIAMGVASITAPAVAQCVADWQRDIGQPGVDTPSLRKGLAITDLGDGPEVLISGRFAGVGGIAANGNARWNPDDGWRTFGESGLTSASGSLLGSNVATTYRGDFYARGDDALCVARWNGDTFAPVGDGFDNTVTALSVTDVGDGQKLYAGGSFLLSGAQPANGFASWTGSAWQSVGDGVSGGSVPGIAAMAEYDLPGVGNALVVTGGFSFAGFDEARNIAIWACGQDCRVDLDGDGSLTIFDFLMFQNLFDDGDLTADFDGDGVLTLFDFLAFQNEFDVGCE